MLAMSAPASSSSTAGAAVVISDVVKRFGAKTALAGVSLELRTHECLGLLGPNGAGKSTLVRGIVGRVLPDSGRISILDMEARSPGARASVGYIPQELALYPLLSVEENLSVFGRYQGLDGESLRRAIRWSLDWAALTERANEPVRQLSGGMKRRLNMAAGLLHKPPIALLDEPTVGVDPQSRERIYTMIDELRRGGASLVYTTHYMEEAERLCDRIAIMDQGRIIALGTRDELVRGAFGAEAELVVHFASLNSTDAVWAHERGGRVEGDAIRFRVARPAEDVGQLLAAARGRGLQVTDLSVKSPTLQSLFLHLTGRELRE